MQVTEETGGAAESSPGPTATVQTQSSQAPGGASPAGVPGPNDQTLLTSLVGQAAAAITLAALLVYGAGALTLALRLAFSRLPWESVLGQLPHDLLLTTGFGQVILPAIITGMVGAVLLDFLINSKKIKYFPENPVMAFLPRAIVVIIIGAVEAGIFLVFYAAHKSEVNYGIVIASWEAFLYVLGISSIAVVIALIFFPRPYGSVPPAAPDAREDVARLSRLEWRVLVGVLVTVAVIPGWAAVSASTLFPYTLACSSSFAENGVHGVHSGNLIGTNGAWAYMTEYRSRVVKGHRVYDHPYVAVVPLSSIRLLVIGNSKYVGGECGNWLTNP
jgi:hypothetical protein